MWYAWFLTLPTYYLLPFSGDQGTQWKGKATDRIQLPHKAAYFSLVAVETMSAMNNNGLDPVLEKLWLLACQLYTSHANEAHGAADEGGSYAWATLRSSTLARALFAGLKLSLCGSFRNAFLLCRRN